METLNQREKKDDVPAPFGTLFFAVFEDFGGPKQASTTFPAKCQHEKGFYVAK